MSEPQPLVTADLITLRDWLRYGVSRFTAAGLVFGHGTTSAQDEAAFLILKTLHLPIDQLEPWLDCRLTRDERERLAALFEARIASRKPASYLVKEAWIQGRSFYVDERVIVPRSYIGELMSDGFDGIIDDADTVSSILDLCTGSGCLAILAADAFPNARIDAVDISDDALDVARQNVGDYGLEDRIDVRPSDLFMGVQGRRYDLILSNPPYVTSQAVSDFPPEYRAEPVLAHLGGEDGLDLVRRILAEAASYLNDNGMLITEVGQCRPALEAAYPDVPFTWLETELSEGEVFVLPASALKKLASVPQ
jgi:ribosomal protein L3 glutamine methyltransferase